MHLDIHSRCLLLVSVEFSNPEYRPQYPCRPQQYRCLDILTFVLSFYFFQCRLQRSWDGFMCVNYDRNVWKFYVRLLLPGRNPGISWGRGVDLRSVSQQSWSLNSYSSYLFDMVLMLRILRSVWNSISPNILFNFKIDYGDLNVFSFRNIKLQSAYSHFNTSIIKNGTKRMQLVGLVGHHSSSISVDCGYRITTKALHKIP